MRVALYARVSTTDQNPESQIETIRKFCSDRGWQVTEEIVDRGFSGASDKRPGLAKLLMLVRARKVDGVVCLKLDRLFRSLQHLTRTLSEFEELGICFTAVNDQIDLSTSAGRLMLNVISSFAQFELDLIRERTKLGIENARKKGKHLGRPKLHSEEKVIEARNSGLSYRAIEKQLGVPQGVVSRIIRDARLKGLIFDSWRNPKGPQQKEILSGPKGVD